MQSRAAGLIFLFDNDTRKVSSNHSEWLLSNKFLSFGKPIYSLQLRTLVLGELLETTFVFSLTNWLLN